MQVYILKAPNALNCNHTFNQCRYGFDREQKLMAKSESLPGWLNPHFVRLHPHLNYLSTPAGWSNMLLLVVK